ncbi:MAG: sigma-70 family RNA polymerase sigma factor [Hyphomicrobiales bacterium]|nr:sigma-70 family RNA polymerase sigma factor [Hyphomicrobiales bacterium]MBV8770062.1 sigma-70 family RNA polymerase sigma factor [Hyphomicrobiales bacterium]MBV9053679.1 sigma-70 family RNA polymerase sigma factor [Hyphomicrobiales bacterium]MBV9135918.1 sigma-70 family RNA polymerase sigma factor [Hyphomicrobiales bacterium]MBV9976160.1 sigma-70 family RNA polymerase sigma factor [Hyphomicrobiales bacterium]
MTKAESEDAGFFTRELLTTIPSLRAFARSLGASPDRADDLVQETLIKAWANQQSFVQGTNLKTWLFTILRNTAYSEYRKRWREVEDADGSYAAGLVSEPTQIAHLDMADFKSALTAVPQEQREALILIGASGFSYDEAAKICGCAVGTIKSRVNRARQRLASTLGLHEDAVEGKIAIEDQTAEEPDHDPVDISSDNSR